MHRFYYWFNFNTGLVENNRNNTIPCYVATFQNVTDVAKSINNYYDLACKNQSCCYIANYIVTCYFATV